MADMIFASRKVRHRIVKAIAPKLYLDAFNNPRRRLDAVPRPMILFVKNRVGHRLLTGVEIGVSKGANAQSIMTELPIKKLYLVDPYAPYVCAKGYVIDSPINEQIAKVRLEQHMDRVEFVKKPSDVAAKHIPDQLDFVYIDGNHSYKWTSKDIQNYYRKVKPDGLIGGHDAFFEFPGVCKAALEHAEHHGLTLHGVNTDWWTVKPAS